MRAFVTGIAGFAGSHLAEALLAAGWEVTGLLAPGEGTHHLAGTRDAIRLVEADIVDAAACDAALAEAAPTCVFHLAAIAFVPDGLRDPLRTYDVNVLGTQNILEAVRTQGGAARVVCVSSGDAYGEVRPGELPITEAQPWRPINPYAATKAAADVLAEAYAQQYGMAVVRARPFNHTGPRQSPRFVCADFARQLARIEVGRQDPILRVGHLEARRDFSDVRDVVRGYMCLADPAVPCRAYNICSGMAPSIADVLEQLRALCTRPVEVQREAARLRPVEVAEHRGSAAALQAATGWAPEFSLERTLADTLTYWREQVAAEAGVQS